MKTQYEVAAEKVQRWAPVWQSRLQLDDYEIEHVFLESYFGDDGEEDFKISAVTESRPQYLEAKIKWFLPSIVRHDDAKLEQTLVHELCHVLLSPEQKLVDEIRDSEWDGANVRADAYAYQVENVTERVSRSLWTAYGSADGTD